MEGNVSFMTALDDEQVAVVADAVKQLYVKLLEASQARSSQGLSQPCEVIL